MNVSVKQERSSDDGWSKAKAIAEYFDFSVHTLKLFRKRHWCLGIHYQYLNSRTVRYNLILIEDWLVNLDDPQNHLRGIETYLSSLPSNQPKKRDRKSK